MVDDDLFENMQKGAFLLDDALRTPVAATLLAHANDLLAAMETLLDLKNVGARWACEG